MAVTQGDSKAGATALHRGNGWAEELLDLAEKMLCSSSPKDGSQASTAALKNSYSCTTSSHKTGDKSPATVLCGISECPSLGLGFASSITAPIKARQGLRGEGATQLSWKTLRTVHLNAPITISSTPLSAADTRERFQIHPEDGRSQPCFQKRCLCFRAPIPFPPSKSPGHFWICLKFPSSLLDTKHQLPACFRNT